MDLTLSVAVKPYCRNSHPDRMLSSRRSVPWATYPPGDFQPCPVKDTTFVLQNAFRWVDLRPKPGGSREVVNVIAQNHTTRALFPPIRSGPALSRHMGFDRMAAQGRQKHANASLFSSRKCL